MLHAGAAVRDISPKASMFLAGYPHVNRMSTGVHDPLQASALFLQNGETALVLIALDLLFLDPRTARELRGRIATALGIPEAQVFISCTHTHSGPLCCNMLAWEQDPIVPRADEDYLAAVQDDAIVAACAAVAAPRPATMAWLAAMAPGVGGNRLDPAGPSDPEVGILAVRDLKGGAPLAASLVYGLHPTVLHEDSTLVSSDFIHYTRQSLREAFGPAFVTVYHNGPCGNLSPRNFVQAQTFAEAERLGRRLGTIVVDALRSAPAPAFHDEVRLQGAICAVDLPPRAIPPVPAAARQLAEARERYERLKRQNAGHGPVRTAECTVFGAEETLALAQAQERGRLAETVARYRRADLQLVCVGDGFLAGFPCETFVEYGLALKAEAPARVFPVSLVNGQLQGYVVTPEAAAAGGYEAMNALFAPESGRLMVNAHLAMLAAMGA